MAFDRLTGFKHFVLCYSQVMINQDQLMLVIIPPRAPNDT